LPSPVRAISVLRIVIAGGGTGGHLYPGIAVAREAVGDGAEVLFIGAEDGIEARVLPREGFNLKTIRAGRFMGMGTFGRLRTVALMPSGVSASAGVMKSFRPGVVLGVGGYASFPAVAAAKLMGLPVVIQEQNAYPGVTNRLLGKVADTVALGFREAENFFPRGKSVFTGNPIRAELLKADREKALTEFGLGADRATVLVFGGSAGAHRINKGMTDAIRRMGALKDKVQFIHQTGEKDMGMVEAAYKVAGFKAKALPFIYDMAGAYACASLVVCRAGALTLAEVTALGKPAILIPYPHAAHNHQEVNARVLERSGAARVIPDPEASGVRLAEEVTALLGDEDALLGMAGRSLSLGRADAARRVYDICKGLARGH